MPATANALTVLVLLSRGVKLAHSRSYSGSLCG